MQYVVAICCMVWAIASVYNAFNYTENNAIIGQVLRAIASGFAAYYCWTWG